MIYRSFVPIISLHDTHTTCTTPSPLNISFLLTHFFVRICIESWLLRRQYRDCLCLRELRWWYCTRIRLSLYIILGKGTTRVGYFSMSPTHHTSTLHYLLLLHFITPLVARTLLQKRRYLLNSNIVDASLNLFFYQQ